MALLFIDSFDNYGTADLAKKWTSVGTYTTIVPNQGRWKGGGALRTLISGFGGGFHVEKAVPNSDTLIVGCNVYIPSGTGELNGITFLDGNSQQIMVNFPSGQIVIRKSNLFTTEVARSAKFMATNAWNFLEVKVRFHATLGSIEVRANGETILNLTNINTLDSANAYANKVRLGFTGSASGTYDVLWDDLYICDTTGTENNNFLGEIRIDGFVPTADGSRSDFVSSYAIPLTKHRYWRLQFYENVGNGYYAIYEVQLRETPGGANVAIGGTGTASVWNNGTTNDGAKAFDGNNTTYWMTPFVTGFQWLLYDFGAGNEKDIREFTITPASGDNPKTFALMYSDDGINFTTHIAPPEQPGVWGTTRTFTYSNPGTEHYKAVDETTLPANDYVRSDIVGAVDTYKFPAYGAGITGAIKAVQLCNTFSKDDAGARSGANFIKSGATEVTLGSTALGGAEASVVSVLVTDPATGVAWTKAGVNAAEFGVTVSG
jgi:hypothetical protein